MLAGILEPCRLTAGEGGPNGTGNGSVIHREPDCAEVCRVSGTKRCDVAWIPHAVQDCASPTDSGRAPGGLLGVLSTVQGRCSRGMDDALLFVCGGLRFGRAQKGSSAPSLPFPAMICCPPQAPTRISLLFGGEDMDVAGITPPTYDNDDVDADEHCSKRDSPTLATRK